MVVEGDLDYRDLEDFFPELKGFEFILTGNGKEAMEIAGKTCRNIIFSSAFILKSFHIAKCAFRQLITRLCLEANIKKIRLDL
jgi:hypothetical protein